MKYFIERGSPSLVGRGIANPMFARTRGFESHSPRFEFCKVLDSVFLDAVNAVKAISNKLFEVDIK